MFQARSDAESRTSSFCGNHENEGQRCRHVEIPIIIETSPDGRANVPFPHIRSDGRASKRSDDFLNCTPNDRNCSSLSAAGEKNNLGTISGLAVGLKRKNITKAPRVPPESSDTCSCSRLENIQEQLRDLSLRLQRLEDKVGSDLEGIYEVLKSSKETITDNIRNSVV